MKDEIKEILYYYQKDIDRYEKNMKNYTEYQQKTTFSKYHQRYKNHKLLLYYITNLQEENERYKRIFEGKERFSKIMPDDIDFIILSKADYDRQQEDIELNAIELKSRIDKAIEYINNNSLYEETYDYNIDDEQELQYVSDETATNDLLNILKGDNK